MCIRDRGRTSATTTFGNTVPTYDRERTLCDVIRQRGAMDVQTYQTAIREYMPVSYTHLDVYKRQVQPCPILRAVLDYCDVVHDVFSFWGQTNGFMCRLLCRLPFMAISSI